MIGDVGGTSAIRKFASSLQSRAFRKIKTKNDFTMEDTVGRQLWMLSDHACRDLALFPSSNESNASSISFLVQSSQIPRKSYHIVPSLAKVNVPQSTLVFSPPLFIPNSVQETVPSLRSNLNRLFPTVAPARWMLQNSVLRDNHNLDLMCPAIRGELNLHIRLDLGVKHLALCVMEPFQGRLFHSGYHIIVVSRPRL